MNHEQKLILYSHMDELAHGQAPSVIPIMVATDYVDFAEVGSNAANAKDIVAIGSAFLMRYRGKNFMVTALHVMENERPKGEVIALINNKSVFLESLDFLTYDGLDIAVAELNSEFLSAQGVVDPPFIETDQEIPPGGLGRYIVFGYPGSNKNRIRIRGESVSCNVTQCHISLELYPGELHIPDLAASICFKHDEKTTVNSSGVKLGSMPPLHGMSGGPVFQMHFDAELKTVPPSRLELAGMLCRKKRIEHHGREASLALVAIPASSICIFINTIFFPTQSYFGTGSDAQEGSR